MSFQPFNQIASQGYVTGAVATLSSSVSSSIASVQTYIAAQDASLQTNITTLSQSTTSALSAATSSILSTVTSLSSSVSSSINALSSSAATSLAAAYTSLNTNITSLSSSAAIALTSATSSLWSTVTAVSSSLVTNISNLNTLSSSLDGRINTLSSSWYPASASIASAIASLVSQDATINTNISTLNTNLTNLSSSVSSTINALSSSGATALAAAYTSLNTSITALSSSAAGSLTASVNALSSSAASSLLSLVTSLGDASLTLRPDKIVLPTGVGHGIKLGTTTGSYGWKSVQGNISLKSFGDDSPSLATYSGTIKDLSFATGNFVSVQFQVPHDYVASSDVYMQIDWSHTGTSATGSFIAAMDYVYGRRASAFSLYANGTSVTGSGDSLATRVQKIEEVKITGGTNQVAVANVEADGVFSFNVLVASTPTVTAGSMFIHAVTMKYQSTGIGTINRDGTIS